MDHVAGKAILETPTLSGKHVRWWLKVFTSDVGRVYCPGYENARAHALTEPCFSNRRTP